MAEKNEHEKMGSNQNKGSGSDTVSAAKISAGTSVGNVGESPMPHTQGGAQGGTQGNKGASGGQSAQSSTLASHTSSPMGGGAGSTGAGGRGGQGQHNQGQHNQGQQQRGQGGSGQGSSGGMTDTMSKTASEVQERAGEAYEQASEWARDTYESATSWASNAGGRSMRGMGGARQGVQNYVAQNPVMVGLVGLAAGLLLGALLPRTRKEDETFGQWADEVREQGLRYAQEMTQRGREYVEQSMSGDDERFARHESEFGGGASSGPTGQGPGATSSGQGANRH